MLHICRWKLISNLQSNNTSNTSIQPHTVYLFELTILFEKPGNMEAANQRTYERYTSLCSDIEEAGYNCKNIPFEVGSRGHFTLENRSRLSIMHKQSQPSQFFQIRPYWDGSLNLRLLCVCVCVRVFSVTGHRISNQCEDDILCLECSRKIQNNVQNRIM